MNNTIQYKGYVGSVEFSEEDGIFFGKVMGIRSLISYELAFKGSFNIRLSPALHKKLFLYATAHQMSINQYIEDTLEASPASKLVI